jgi:outer membrane immunogenic protein
MFKNKYLIDQGMSPMRKFAIAAVLAASVTSPAFAAGEARIEARGGVAWTADVTEAFAGIGAGYDFDLGDKAFAGVDLGADKILANGAKVVWSAGGRLGAKVGGKGKAYVAAGVGFCCSESAVYAGAGYQHKLNDSIYGKIEYRHGFGAFDINYVGVGVGAAF